MKENYFFWIILLAVVGFWALDSTLDLNTFGTALSSSDRPLGFTEIRPLFQTKCTSCHSSKDDDDWTNYETAFKNRTKIKMRVSTLRDMPLGGDMTSEERDWIKVWVDGGGKK